jgi:hypothetical protein
VLTHTINGLTIGEEYQIQLVGSADDRSCCSGFVARVDGGDEGGGVTLPRFADIDGDLIGHVPTVIGTFTADATTQSFVTTGGLVDGLGGFSAVIVSSDQPFGGVNVDVIIDRATGGVTLTNLSVVEGLEFIGYSLTSAAGSFDQTGWKTIADNYDADGPNTADMGALIGTVDIDDNWTVLSDPNVDTDLSEGELDAGNGGQIGPGQSIDLGTPWRQTPFEDVFAQLLLSDGTILDLTVVYTGDEILFGDLDGNGEINELDWQAFKSGQGMNFAGMSEAASYQLGNLFADGVHDLRDFSLFEQAYNSANGPGALAAVIASVPEPSSVMLLTLAGTVFCAPLRRRLAKRLGLFLLLFGALLATAPSASAVLVAHWTFDSDFDSAVGTVTSAAGGNAVIDTVDSRVGGGSLRLDGVGDFVSVSNAPSLNGLANWSIAGFIRLNSENAVFNAIYATDGFSPGDVHINHRSDSNPNVLETAQSGATFLVTGAPALDLPQNNWVHVASTWDGTTLRNYVNGVDVGSVASGGSPANFNTARIGSFAGDASRDFDGRIDDLRIYSSVLSASEVGELATIDAGGIFRLGINVNTVTGNITLTNDTDSAVDFDSYQILSPGDGPSFIGSLNPSGWNSIAERAVPISGFPQGTGSGNGWEQGPNVSANELIEWYLLDEASPSSLASGASINLGNAFDTAVGNQDLVFTYRRTDGTVLSGLVNYVDAALPGDFNNDGRVDAADYTVWRDNLGAADESGINNNGDGGGVTASDYTFWRARFGNTAGSGSGSLSPAAVPEPSSLGILILAMGVMGIGWARRAA